MRQAILLLILLSVLSIPSHGASFDPTHPPNSYRNADNPLYWRNKRPDRDYWQQDVHYRIRARIDEKKDIIEGEMELTYWNNSPDTLQEVYFHLYQNAFQPCSYYDKLRRANKRNPSYGQHGSKGRGTEVESIRVNGEEVKTELDNTILWVELPEELLEGEKLRFSIAFKTYFDEKGSWRRMDLFRTRDGHKHYNGVHWYPRISVYDRRFGWTTDQHLGKEFYGDFGTFDVKLDFPSNFIVGATGKLQNRKEVMPDSLREALDIEHFKDKPWNSPASTIIPYDSTERKTWHFYAENVHDFSFTADPSYRIDTVIQDGVVCKALVQEGHASGWTNAADITASAVKTFSRDIGPYAHHKLIVADARSGMEYPMLTLCGGRDPGYRDLIVHEVGHQWFQGMVGTNETYRAAMDEGFTQFLTAHGLECMDGDTLVLDPGKAYRELFEKPQRARDREVYLGYLSKAIKKEDAFLNTHSDDFGGEPGHGGGYRQVYYKMGTMLYNLQYVLGDSLFWEAMQHYFSRWRIAHPYFEDFRSSVIRRTGVDLNWFFDQWWSTRKRIDYAVKKVRRIGFSDRYRIVLERKGEMQMPIDLRLIRKDGEQRDFHIPNTWFVKDTDAEVLGRWTGWGKKLQKHYVFEVEVPEGIRELIIDPSGRLGDVDRRNNRKHPPIKLDFDAGLRQNPDLRNYEVKWRPALWYNSIDGVKAGLHSKGDYLDHEGRYKASVWGNTRLFRNYAPNAGLDRGLENYIAYDLEYRTGTEEWVQGSYLEFSSRWNDGLSRHSAGWGMEFPSGDDRLAFRFISMRRPTVDHQRYLLDELNWGGTEANRSIELRYQHEIEHLHGDGSLSGELRSMAFSPAYDMSYARFIARDRSSIGPLQLRSRLFGQFGVGAELPPESMLYLAGGSPEAMMEQPLTRSKAFVPQGSVGHGANTRHFHYGGGLGLRGYSGYLAPSLDEERDTVLTGYQGISGAALNLELEFQELLGLRNPVLGQQLDVASYLFMDAGLMELDHASVNPVWGPLRMDAGVGAAFTLKRVGPVEEIEPVTLRVDLPLFLNRTPAENPEFFQFRWLIGISRAF